MALKELIRHTHTLKSETDKNEAMVQEFISQGGSVPETQGGEEQDHRLTLRIPHWLIAKIDEKRKERIGSISRNLWILEQLDKACKK